MFQRGHQTEEGKISSFRRLIQIVLDYCSVLPKLKLLIEHSDMIGPVFKLHVVPGHSLLPFLFLRSSYSLAFEFLETSLSRMVNVSPRFFYPVVSSPFAKRVTFLCINPEKSRFIVRRSVFECHSPRRSFFWRPLATPMSSMGNGGGKGDAETVASVKSRIEELIKSNKVVIFAKGYCPYCHKARDAFKDIGYTDFLWVELGEEQNGSVMQSVLGAMTGATTVPRVFINGKCIGGGDDTAKLKRSGELQRMVAA